MKRLILPTLLVAAFLAGVVSPADGAESVVGVERLLEKISDSLREIARHSDREVRVVCECRS